MHFDRTAFKTRRPTAQTSRPKSILIYGEINTDAALAQVEMMKLTAALVDAGHTVETAAPTANPMVRNIVNFRTPHKFKQSTAFMTRYDHCVVFLETIRTPKYRSKNLWGKTKERMRILKFARHLQDAGRDVTLIGTPLQCFGAAALARDHRATKFATTNGAAQAYQTILGAKIPLQDMTTTQNTVIEHANFRNSDGKFTALKLHRYLTATKTTDHALTQICTFATHHSLYKTSVIKRLKKQTVPNDPFIQHSLPPYPVLDMALAPDPALKIPTYAAHLLNVLNRKHTFNLKTPTGRNDAMKWYHTTAREKLSEFWVPGPSVNVDGTALIPSDAMVDQIEAFLNNPVKEPHHSLELNRLLHLRRFRNGPTGMAILLALLCRIKLSTDSRMNPWKSTEIATWFAKSPCAIAPVFTGFASRKITPLAPDHITEIIGLPKQETGLGVNMRMSLQAFDKIGLYYKTRNLDTGFKQIDGRHSSRAAKGDFVLHHINAERVPMNIMTPQYAHRNDVYHVGFFLWETSRVPTAHRLGINMVNEIWAPSTFVADLYRQAGAKTVTMVGKALNELDYLTKLSSITRPDPNLFTFFSGFDFHSSVERKNPMAVVQAFQNTFTKSKHPDHRLVLKTTPTTTGHWGDPMDQLGQIRRAASHDPRITLIEKMLPLEYLFRLMARADCVVSAHRGEGFGYLPAYALGLCKPTIVTDWGGVTDFCNPQTAYPVDYKLVNVPQDHAIYNAHGAQWADIDMTDLSQKMWDVYHNADTAKTRADAGQKHVQDRYSMDRLAKTYETRLSQIGLI